MPQKEDQRYQQKGHALQHNAGAHERVGAARTTTALHQTEHAGTEHAQDGQHHDEQKDPENRCHAPDIRRRCRLCTHWFACSAC
jgi:hypothetical protein